MNNKRATKRALLTSVMALAMCVVMLAGTTFAWFTDTASTGVNKIVAGNLDVALEYATKWDNNGNVTKWENAEGKTLQFKKAAGAPADEQVLWEPGCTYELPELRVVNKGNLALKYIIKVTGIETNHEVVPGEPNLKDVIDWTIKYGTNKVEDNTGDIPVVTGYSLNPGASDVVTIKGEMDKNAGNEYQGLSIDGVSVTVYATQMTAEFDSFNNEYDKDAQYPTDADALQNALTVGGNIVLAGNADPSVAIVATKTATINANGKTIANTGDVWDVAPNSWSLISARENADLTITGNGTFKAKENDCYAVDVQDGATVTIENGTFIGNIHAVYVYEGTANIKGGFYSVQQKYTDASKADEFVLNCYDANRANGTAKIIVTGGTFVNFNPADCWAEGAGTNFVAPGYKVVSEVQTNGDTWYTVVPNTVSSQDELNNAISGATGAVGVQLPAGTYELPNLDSRDVTIIGTKDTVIDMKNKDNKASSASFEGVTVNFGTDNYVGFKHTGKLTYKDCTITGKQFLYANDVEFINCTFVQDAVDYNVWTYGAGSVLFKDCNFDCKGKAVLVYNEGYVAGQTVEFQNCKFNASAPVAGKAAIEIDCTFTSYNVVIDKATADGVTNFANGSVSGSPVWNVKKGSNPTTVTLDGTQVYPTV